MPTFFSSLIERYEKDCGKGSRPFGASDDQIGEFVRVVIQRGVLELVRVVVGTTSDDKEHNNVHVLKVN